MLIQRNGNIATKMVAPNVPMHYEYRGLACDCAKEPWYVSGTELDAKGWPNGGGILEWCYDRVDAIDRLTKMQNYPGQFKGLKFGKYQQQ